MNKRQLEVIKSQMRDEERALKELKQVYNKALKDVEANIQVLRGRTDFENIQSIIYQTQYQEAIKAQIEARLDILNSQQFDKMSDYLSHCYESGFVGSMYDLHGQGIPIIAAIDESDVIRALQTDSKISGNLYTKLGVDTKELKDSIRANLSRGFSAGADWDVIARNLDTRMQIGFNRAARIVRTEGHRVRCEASFHAQQVAKSKGADVMKQWDATLDGRTRPNHRLLDGKIVEVDEPFEIDGNEAMYPGEFGVAREDVNCRCQALQRAKWALDEDELQTLKDRAAYYGLDKTQDFEDFTAKYLQAARPLAVVEAAVSNGLYVFTPASTIREAEAYAQSLGIPNVSYSGIEVEVANAMNEALTNAINYCPKLKDQMQFYGTAQARNKGIKKELEAYYQRYFEDKGYNLPLATKYAKKYASHFVGKVSSNTYALAYSGEIRGMNITDELRQIVGRWSGIGVNANIGNDAAQMLIQVKHDMSVGWHPQGCNNIRSIFDHEFGHQLDYAFGLRKNSEINAIWFGMTKSERVLAVSEYGGTNINEFIAEAYAEYVNSPTPRPTSVKIGKIIEGMVKK